MAIPSASPRAPDPARVPSPIVGHLEIDDRPLDLPDTRTLRVIRAVQAVCRKHDLSLTEPQNRIVAVQGASFATAMNHALEVR